MGISNKTWVDNSAPTCNADDLNGMNLEVNNAIEDSGQTLSYTDRTQLTKALWTYWQADVSYIIGSIVRKTATDELYKSLVNSNLNNALPSKADNVSWQYLGDLESLLKADTVEIIDYTEVGEVGDALQIMAGHTLTADDEDIIGDAIAIYNLADNTDLTGNGNTLDDADAYNAGTGILGVATTAHLGVNGEHLQADGIDDFSGTGDLAITIAGWHKMLVSGGGVALGTNSATQKMQYYTDANGYVVFDIAGVTGLSSSYVIGKWVHIALAYDPVLSVAYAYIDGRCEAVISATSNLALQASPSIWINSKTDGTLEVASLHDEIIVIEKALNFQQIQQLIANKISEPLALQSKEYEIVEKVKNQGDTNLISETQCQVISKYNNELYIQGYQYAEDDEVKLSGRKL
jgi:hypothetical protein